MIEIHGIFNSAYCFCDSLEDGAKAQIKTVCDQPEFAGSVIRIMPDVHAGKGCTIGTTMTVTDKIVPGMVGVDIGCGMETAEIAENVIDFERFDKVIRRSIPSGRDIRKDYHALNNEIDLTELRCAAHVKLDRARHSIGTLGGGNHFIEADLSEGGKLYIVVHSGSRHIGTEVAEFYQDQAWKTLSGNSKSQLNEVIARLKSERRHKEIKQTVDSFKRDEAGSKISVPKDLAYVKGSLFVDYIHDMKIIQRFAALNRQAMMEIILREMKFEKLSGFTTVHNYIDTDSMILRKGAVSAKNGEMLLIPINMRDGSLICTGRGNADWNYSAPHGAGRIMSRSAALRSLKMEEYKAGMKGVFSTCVNKDTLDESPMAYKSMESIIKQIEPTAEIVMHIKPVYNFKAGE